MDLNSVNGRCKRYFYFGEPPDCHPVQPKSTVELTTNSTLKHELALDNAQITGNGHSLMTQDWINKWGDGQRHQLATESFSWDINSSAPWQGTPLEPDMQQNGLSLPTMTTIPLLWDKYHSWTWQNMSWPIDPVPLSWDGNFTESFAPRIGTSSTHHTSRDDYFLSQSIAYQE